MMSRRRRMSAAASRPEPGRAPARGDGFRPPFFRPGLDLALVTFRATGITAYLSNGGTPEHAQEIAGHASPRTTKLYDRTADTVTLDEIERIVI